MVMIEDYIIANLFLVSHKLIEHALTHREFTGFTGNTQTSYCCGIYLYGKLRGIVSAQSGHPKPVRLKVEKGRIVFLGNPYEGYPRSVQGAVDVDRLYGEDTSISFLRSYSPNKKHVALVMTTGTEYSEYLERSLNVLTVTYLSAANVMASNWKPMS